ncbi:hypothetical protein [Paenibacillus sp. PL91]|nr:hypothetical protein [Paenibacillus sp. PL91]
MAMINQLNIPEWPVYVQAAVTLVIPVIIFYIFKKLRPTEDE